MFRKPDLMNRDDRILLLCKLAFDGIYFGVGDSCVLEAKIRLSHHIISLLTEPLLFWIIVSLDCAFSRPGRAFCNLILASSMAIDFDFFWSKDDIRSSIWSILSSSFRSTLWVSGLFLSCPREPTGAAAVGRSP